MQFTHCWKISSEIFLDPTTTLRGFCARSLWPFCVYQTLSRLSAGIYSTTPKAQESRQRLGREIIKYFRHLNHCRRPKLAWSFTLSSMSWSKLNRTNKTKLLADWLPPSAVVGKPNILLCEMQEKKTPKDSYNQAVSARTACQRLCTQVYYCCLAQNPSLLRWIRIWELDDEKKGKKKQVAGLQDLPKPWHGGESGLFDGGANGRFLSASNNDVIMWPFAMQRGKDCWQDFWGSPFDRRGHWKHIEVTEDLSLALRCFETEVVRDCLNVFKVYNFMSKNVF